MRNESELMRDFKQGDDGSLAYFRERVIFELMIDIRSLLNKLVSKL